jgi:hypothetical protein
MTDNRLRNHMGFHPRLSDVEARRREAVLRIAERHFTAAEYADLMTDMADDRVDVRIYDDGIVLMRKF